MKFGGGGQKKLYFYFWVSSTYTMYLNIYLLQPSTLGSLVFFVCKKKKKQKWEDIVKPSLAQSHSGWREWMWTWMWSRSSKTWKLEPRSVALVEKEGSAYMLYLFPYLPTYLPTAARAPRRPRPKKKPEKKKLSVRGQIRRLTCQFFPGFNFLVLRMYCSVYAY